MSIKAVALMALLLTAVIGGSAGIYYGSGQSAPDALSVRGEPSESERAGHEPQSHEPEIAALAPDAVDRPEDGESSSAGASSSVPAVEETEKAGEPRHMAPRFDLVRVEPSGDMVVAGRAAARASVELMLNGEPFDSVVSGKDGDWVMVPTPPLPVGNHMLLLRATGEDGRGKPIEGDRLAVAVLGNDRRPLVVVTRPGEPVRVVQLPDETTARDSGDRIEAGPSTSQRADASDASEPPVEVPEAEPFFLAIDSVEAEEPHHLRVTGRAETGLKIRIYVNAEHLADTKPGASGHWTTREEHELPLGRHTVRADLIDPEGRVRARAQVQFDRLQVVLAQSNEDDEASSNNDEAESHNIAIERGDNLWRVAQDIYGQGTRYSVIYEANRNQIADPNLIFPGQVFTVPVLDAPSE